MKTKRIIAMMLGAAMCASGMTACNSGSEDMGEMSTMEVVKDMGMGINLGNTMESCGTWINSSSVTNYETAWGSPVITEDMIKGYRAAGFGVLRVPVAWSNMMQADYTIHPDYLARVEEIVGWALDAELYVILNIHYDSGWWTDFPKEKDECMKKYTRVWEQLCEAFEEYDEYLMFESLNEEGGWDSLWNRYSGSSDGKAESFGLLNEINQKFVDVVRKSGGNNAQRHLLIAGYNTDVVLTCDDLFKMPKDPAKRCAVSVHYYTPATFCILTEDADWGKAKTEWGSDQDVAELNKYMDMLKTEFVDQGIPVIIGEYGVGVENKTRENINRFVTAVCEAAYTRDMCPVLWSTTGNFYDREKCVMYDSDLNNALLDIVGEVVMAG
ncbi:MAG: glycoside hydrolase family 5 protein [Oscillospiraceae bacterium]|nr:glycoside hydrolase family 5 protein [Oscillospiraceae bacterium]